MGVPKCRWEVLSWLHWNLWCTSEALQDLADPVDSEDVLEVVLEVILEVVLVSIRDASV